MLRIHYPYPDVSPNANPRYVEELQQKGLTARVALGYYDSKSECWVSKGVWKINPYETVNVLEGTLDQKYYYLSIFGPSFYRIDGNREVGVATKCEWDLPTETKEMFVGDHFGDSFRENSTEFTKRDALRPKHKYNVFKDFVSAMTFGSVFSDYVDSDNGTGYTRFKPFTIGDYCLDNFTFEMKFIIEPYHRLSGLPPQHYHHPPHK